MPTDEALRNHYSNLDDGRLVQLAGEVSTLTPSARAVLSEELRRRGFDNREIDKYQQELSMWEVQSSGLPIANRMNGCGTTRPLGRAPGWLIHDGEMDHHILDPRLASGSNESSESNFAEWFSRL